MDNPRKIAYDVLVRCASAEQYSNIALDIAIKRANLTAPDRGLLTTLVYGVIERQITLDAIIKGLCSRGSDEISPDVRVLLRLGLYQLAFLDRVPDHAAVNETVNMAPKRNRGFVNAILRAFIRSEKKIPLPDKETDALCICQSNILSLLHFVANLSTPSHWSAPKSFLPPLARRPT